MSQITRRNLALADEQDDDVIAVALDAQADRDARLAQLFAMPIGREDGLTTLSGPGNLTREFKNSIEEARRLLAESYIVVGLLRGLRGFKAPSLTSEPQTLGDILTQESIAALKAAGLFVEPTQEETEEPATA